MRWGEPAWQGLRCARRAAKRRPKSAECPRHASEGRGRAPGAPICASCLRSGLKKVTSGETELNSPAAIRLASSSELDPSLAALAPVSTASARATTLSSSSASAAAGSLSMMARKATRRPAGLAGPSQMPATRRALRSGAAHAAGARAATAPGRRTAASCVARAVSGAQPAGYIQSGSRCLRRQDRAAKREARTARGRRA